MKFVIFISHKRSRVWTRYFTRLYIIISSTCVIFWVNLDDFFTIVCTGFHEVMVCTRYVPIYIGGEGGGGNFEFSPSPLVSSRFTNWPLGRHMRPINIMGWAIPPIVALKTGGAQRWAGGTKDMGRIGRRGCQAEGERIYRGPKPG